MSRIAAQLEHLLVGHRAHAALVTDKDGAVVLQASPSNLPAIVLEPAFTASFLLSADHIAKVGLGRARSLFCVYGPYGIAQFAGDSPLLLTLITHKGADFSDVLALGESLVPVVDSIAQMLAQDHSLQ